MARPNRASPSLDLNVGPSFPAIVTTRYLPATFAAAGLVASINQPTPKQTPSRPQPSPRTLGIAGLIQELERGCLVVQQEAGGKSSVLLVAQHRATTLWVVDTISTCKLEI
jgi:hypothetical protein